MGCALYKEDRAMHIGIYPHIRSQAGRKVSVESVCGMIRDGYQADADRYRGMMATASKEELRQFKDTRLSYVTWAGIFRQGKRDDDNLHTPSGLVFVELDDVGAEQAAQWRAWLGEQPHVLAAYVSVGGGGIHAIVRVEPKPITAARYKDAWQSVMEYLEWEGIDEADNSVSNISRPCYVSKDPEIVVNMDAEPLRVNQLTRDVDDGKGKLAAQRVQPLGSERAPTLDEWESGFRAAGKNPRRRHEGSKTLMECGCPFCGDGDSASRVHFEVGDSGEVIPTCRQCRRSFSEFVVEIFPADYTLCVKCGKNHHRLNRDSCYDCRERKAEWPLCPECKVTKRNPDYDTCRGCYVNQGNVIHPTSNTGDTGAAGGLLSIASSRSNRSLAPSAIGCITFP